MKRVVIDARESGTSTGRYIDKLLENMAKLKPDLEIIVLTKKHRTGFMKLIAPQFKVIETSYREFGFGEQLGLWWQIHKLRPALVHFAIAHQPVLYRGKAVTTVHDLTTVRFTNPAKNYLIFKLKQRVYAWLLMRVAKKSKAILTPSKFVASDIENFAHISPDKITVTYEAADKIKEKSEPVQSLTGKVFIMYVGRPQPHKNLPGLIDAFELLQANHPDLHLVLAGKKDPLYQRFELDTVRREIKNIVFTDFVSEGQLRWLYENTAAYVFPSLSEGFGLPGLEAMAHGAPVVSSNLTCLPEIYGDAAHYFDPTDPGDIAQKIGEVIEDKKLRATLIDRGYRQAAKYSWQKAAKQTIVVYKDSLV